MVVIITFGTFDLLHIGTKNGRFQSKIFDFK